MILVETEYMKIELIPLEGKGEDWMMGEFTFKGEALQVTIKKGLIGDSEMLNRVSSQYFAFTTEKPTILFSLAEPTRVQP